MRNTNKHAFANCYQFYTTFGGSKLVPKVHVFGLFWHFISHYINPKPQRDSCIGENPSKHWLETFRPQFSFTKCSSTTPCLHASLTPQSPPPPPPSFLYKCLHIPLCIKRLITSKVEYFPNGINFQYHGMVGLLFGPIPFFKILQIKKKKRNTQCTFKRCELWTTHLMQTFSILSWVLVLGFALSLLICGDPPSNLTFDLFLLAFHGENEWGILGFFSWFIFLWQLISCSPLPFPIHTCHWWYLQDFFNPFIFHSFFILIIMYSLQIKCKIKLEATSFIEIKVCAKLSWSWV